MGSQALRSRAGRRVARARPRRGDPRPLRRGGGGRWTARVRGARGGAVGGAQDHPRNFPRSGRYGSEGRRARRRLDSRPHALRRVPRGPGRGGGRHGAGRHRSRRDEPGYGWWLARTAARRRRRGNAAGAHRDRRGRRGSDGGPLGRARYPRAGARYGVVRAVRPRGHRLRPGRDLPAVRGADRAGRVRVAVPQGARYRQRRARPGRTQGRRPQCPAIPRSVDRPALPRGRQDGIHGGRRDRAYHDQGDLHRRRHAGGRRGAHDQPALRRRHRERHEGRPPRGSDCRGGDLRRRHGRRATERVSRRVDGAPGRRPSAVLPHQARSRRRGRRVLQFARPDGERDPGREADAGPHLYARARPPPPTYPGRREVLHLMLSIDLRGKRALVAGVADDGGYGFAIAKALAEAGATVCAGTWPPALNIFLNLLERGKIDESRRMPDGSLLQFEKIYPLDATFDTLAEAPEEIRGNKRYKDVGDFSIAGLAQRLVQDFGDRPLDIVVHSLANGPEVKKPLLDTSRAGYLAAVSASAYSLVSLVARLAPLMRPGGSFLSLTYMASERVVPGYGGGMSSAKAALESDTRTLAFEAGRKYRRRVEPLSAGPLASRAASAIGKIEKMVDYYAANAPLTEPLTAREVATTAAFLASPLGSGITGATIYVDKGYHAMGAAVATGNLL